MKKSLTLVFLVVCVLFTGAGSADLLVGQTDAFYHLGDELNISVLISPLISMNTFLIVKLSCLEVFVGNQSINLTAAMNLSELKNYKMHDIELFRGPYDVKAGEEREVLISAKLDRNLVGNLSGSCSIIANYGGEEGNSRKFEISNKLDVEFETDKVVYEPGENVALSGLANKAKGGAVDGFVEALVVEPNITILGTVNGGKFKLNFSIPKDMRAGKYEISMRAYEKEENGMLINEGFSSGSFEVMQVMRKAEFSFSNQSVVPGNIFYYQVFIYDQARDEMQGEVTIHIYKPDKSEFLQRLIEANSNYEFKVEKNYTPGYWSVDGKIGEIEIEKIFLIEELEIASFELVNETLIITNVGNVPYTRPVEIKIGGVSEVKEMNLGLGESKTFRLRAPDGDYNVEVFDGDKSENLGTTSLTGNAIRISDIGLFSSLQDNFYILIWVLIILILLVIIILVIRKFLKRSKFDKKPKIKTIDMIKSGEARSSNVIDAGTKQECSVISLKIRNLEDVRKKGGIDAVDRALLKAKDSRAKIYVVGEYRVIILCPLLTMAQDNSMNAVNVARQIKEVLDEHNAKRGKIDFGIGISSGVLVVEKKDGGLKFSSISAAIPLAKRISDSSHGEILLSKDLHSRVVGKVRSEKYPGREYWIVKKISDRTQYREFVDKFND